jgi:hypothetical protein
MRMGGSAVCCYVDIFSKQAENTSYKNCGHSPNRVQEWAEEDIQVIKEASISRANDTLLEKIDERLARTVYVYGEVCITSAELQNLGQHLGSQPLNRMGSLSFYNICNTGPQILQMYLKDCPVSPFTTSKG